MNTTTGAVSYRIDQDDRIVAVGGEWDAFARANRGEAILSNRVTGQSIYRYFAGPEVTEIMRSLFDRVRSGETSFSIPFRCDSPEQVRHLELTLSPLPHGGIDFRSTIILESPHPQPADLLDTDAPRSEESITLCAWCRKVRTPEWLDLDEAIRRLHLLDIVPMPQISHAICPECEAKLLGQSERHTG